MTAEELSQLFKTHAAEFKKFDRVANKRSHRPDLHAMALLDSLVPAPRDMLRFAEHGTIYLDVTPAELAAVADEKTVIELTRSGLKIDLTWSGTGRGLYLDH